MLKIDSEITDDGRLREFLRPAVRDGETQVVEGLQQLVCLGHDAALSDRRAAGRQQPLLFFISLVWREVAGGAAGAAHRVGGSVVVAGEPALQRRPARG